MMVLLIKNGQPEDSLDYWRQLVCVHGLNGMAITPETYNLAIKCATRADNLEEMEAVVNMMEVIFLMADLIVSLACPEGVRAYPHLPPKPTRLSTADLGAPLTNTHYNALAGLDSNRLFLR